VSPGCLNEKGEAVPKTTSPFSFNAPGFSYLMTRSAPILVADVTGGWILI